MLRDVCLVAAVMLSTAATPPTSSENVSADELFDDPDAYPDGTGVQLDDAVVRSKSGNVLRIAAGTHVMYVAPSDPSSLEFLTMGTRVDVQGTLRRTPTAPQARLIYAMSRGEAQRLARTPFFVDGAVVLPAK